MIIKYVEHSCFLLQGSCRIEIDPMPITGKKEADIALITHAHSDHLGQHPEKLPKSYAIHELANWLKSLGVDSIGMNIGGTAQYKDVSITMVPALHSSSIIENGKPIYMGEPCGFIIKMDGKTIYHAGDTGLFSDMKLIRDLYHPNVALLPVGGLFTMGPKEAMIAAEYIGAPIIIPMHYNTFPAIKQELTGFKRSIELTTSMKVELLSPGSSLTL